MADILPILMPDEQHENKVVKCIRTGRYEQALDLIDKGEAINDKDKSGWTPLTALMHFGSGNDGHINCLNCAISRGADIDAQGIHGWTALMYAANHNHNICLLHLLERGANLHVTNHSNETAVRYIKSNNHCLTAYEEWKVPK